MSEYLKCSSSRINVENINGKYVPTFRRSVVTPLSESLSGFLALIYPEVSALVFFEVSEKFTVSEDLSLQKQYRVIEKDGRDLKPL